MICGLKITWMLRKHLGEVLRLERNVFPEPLTESEFFDMCRRGHGNHPIVALLQGQVLGYMLYHCGTRHYEILSMAVNARWQREGVGRRMIGHMKDKLRPASRRIKLVAVVREANLPAQLFFRAMGFRATGIERQPWEGFDQDGYRFVFRVPALDSRPSTPASQLSESE